MLNHIALIIFLLIAVLGTGFSLVVLILPMYKDTLDARRRRRADRACLKAQRFCDSLPKETCTTWVQLDFEVIYEANQKKAYEEELLRAGWIKEGDGLFTKPCRFPDVHKQPSQIQTCA